MDTVVYTMWGSFLLGLAAGACHLGAIIVGVLREPLPAHLTGGGTSHVRTQSSAGTSGSREPDPAWMHVPSLSERLVDRPESTHP